MDPITSTIPSEPTKEEYFWHEGVESLENYRLGGYHPVNLGDTFSAGRYEVVHKLGYGTYSTVWLCRDIHKQCYVAIKVGVSSDATKERQERSESKVLHALQNGDSGHPGARFFTSLLDEFTIDGPNGHHSCLVFPVTGCSVSIAKVASVSDNYMFPAKVARSIATQALLALSHIHSRGIIHSDLHTGNILIQAPFYDSWPISKIYERLGHPQKLSVLRRDGTPPGPGVPQYQLRDAEIIIPSDIADPDCKILIADFGEARFARVAAESSSPATLNTPILLLPPETIFSHPITYGIDVWTMGMSIFEMLGQGALFEAFFPDENSVLIEAISTLGPLPEKWWQAWPKRSEFFRDDGSYRDDISRPFETVKKPLAYRIRNRMGRGADSTTDKFSDLEMQSLEELLQSMLQYEPKNRITVNEALRTRWVREYGIPALKEGNPDIDLSYLRLC